MCSGMGSGECRTTPACDAYRVTEIFLFQLAFVMHLKIQGSWGGFTWDIVWLSWEDYMCAILRGCAIPLTVLESADLVIGGIYWLGDLL